MERCNEQSRVICVDVDQNIKCIFLLLDVLDFCAVELTLTEVCGVGAASERSPDLKGITTRSAGSKAAGSQSERSPAQ